MPLIGLWMASRIVGGRGKGQSLAALPAAGQGRRRGVGMPRLLSALHPRGASQYVTGPRPEAARVPADLDEASFLRFAGAPGSDPVDLWAGIGFMVRPGDDCRVSGDVGGSLGDWGGVGPRGLPGARGRVAGPGDAAALLRLKQRLDRETSFMLLEVGERDTSVRVLARQLEDMARSGNSVVIVAEIGADLAGYVELAGGEFRRNRATAQLVIGVLAEASGKGVGSGLLEEAKRWAAAHGLHRLELTVMTHNRRAAGLYQRAGFSVESRRAECLLVDGRFVDELHMAVLVPGGHPADPA